MVILREKDTLLMILLVAIPTVAAVVISRPLLLAACSSKLSRKFFLYSPMASPRFFLISSSSAFFFAIPVRMSGFADFEIRIEAVFERAEVLDFNIVEQAVNAGVQDRNLLLKRKRLELWLL